MERINVILPPEVLARMDKRVLPFKRSQWLAYAAQALMARLEGRVMDAVLYENMAKELMKS